MTVAVFGEKPAKPEYLRDLILEGRNAVRRHEFTRL